MWIPHKNVDIFNKKEKIHNIFKKNVQNNFQKVQMIKYILLRKINQSLKTAYLKLNNLHRFH